MLAAVAALSLATGAHASVVYDNGGPTPGGLGNETVAWVQSEDFTFATNTAITGAGVYLAGRGNVAAWDGNFQYYIFNNNGGAPGTIASSGSVTPIVTDTGTTWCCGGDAYKFAFNISTFNAVAGNTYWFGIHAGAPTNFNRDEIYWVNTLPNGTASGQESNGGTFNNWNNNSTEHAFYLNGTGAVPEPATWAMMLMGFGLVGFGLRNRRKPVVRVTYA